MRYTTCPGCWVHAVVSILLSHEYKVSMLVFACIVPFVNGEYGNFSLSLLFNCLRTRAFSRTFQVTLGYSPISTADKFSN